MFTAAAATAAAAAVAAAAGVRVRVEMHAALLQIIVIKLRCWRVKEEERNKINTDYKMKGLQHLMLSPPPQNTKTLNPKP